MNPNDIEEGDHLYLRMIEVEQPPAKEITPDTPVDETRAIEQSVSVLVDEIQADSVVVIREPFGDQERLSVDPEHLYPYWQPTEYDE